MRGRFQGIDRLIPVQIQVDRPIRQTGVGELAGQRRITNPVPIHIIPNHAADRPVQIAEVRKVAGHDIDSGGHRHRLPAVETGRDVPPRGQNLRDFVVAFGQADEGVFAARIRQGRGLSRVGDPVVIQVQEHRPVRQARFRELARAGVHVADTIQVHVVPDSAPQGA